MPVGVSLEVNKVLVSTKPKERTASPERTVFEWIECLPVPAWVTLLNGDLQAVNSLAARLGAGAGKPCGRYAHCDGGCFALKQKHEANESERREGRLMNLPTADNKERSFQVFASDCGRGDPLSSEQSCILHIAFDVQRARRIESYFQRIVERSQPEHQHERPVPRLTKREIEILDLLAEDETLWGIADRLCLSYCTVRNHVQHILAKFGVHSIIEAVAYYLTMSESIRQQVRSAANERGRRQLLSVGSADNSP